jgi:tetratricopeptide repeat protein
VTQPRKLLERALKDAEARLRNHPGSVAIMFERAQLLDRLGRADDARLAYVEILQRDASHFGALNDLGMLLFKAGLRQEAFTCFNAAVAKHPREAIGHANLGFVLLRGGEAQQAREHYQTAVSLDPNNAEARRGLALALEALGERESAAVHRDIGFGAAPVIELPYKGEGRGVRVLLLVRAGPGNVPTDRFLDDRTFAVAKLVADSYRPSVALPAHDLIFNAIGDADVKDDALARAAEIVERSGAPVVNAPSAVTPTGRVENARRLRGLEGVVAPRAAAYSKASLVAADAFNRLESDGFQVPFLLRAAGFHTGEHFERVERREDLHAIAAALPGDELLAIEFVDVRSPDGNARKYRVLFIDGRLYPLHLAVSPNWKVHYFSAAMADHAERRAEEERFLHDMRGVLSSRAIEALKRVATTVGLEYAGADFAIDARGNVVLFEANATMIVPVPDADPRWAYRRAPVARIEAAVRAMLLERAAKTTR